MKDLGKSEPPAPLACSTPVKGGQPARRCANYEVFGETVRREREAAGRSNSGIICPDGVPDIAKYEGFGEGAVQPGTCLTL